ncbi:phage tail tube protein [soil metagenome]
MTTEARIGHGTLLAWESSAGVYTTLAERANISGPGMQADQPDATNMDSANGWREFIAGLKDAGELTVEANYLPGNATQNATTGVLSLFASQDLKNWKLTFPTTPAVDWILPARVSAFEPDLPVDDKMMLSITLKISGEPTLA